VGNFFDTAKKNIYSITTKVMGYDAVWINSDTEEEFTAQVHFKDSTTKEDLFNLQYMPIDPIMEYKQSDFPSLKQAANDSKRNEYVTIDGVGEYWVRSVNQKYDGDTYWAQLAVKE
jgi:hypothetical protein